MISWHYVRMESFEPHKKKTPFVIAGLCLLYCIGSVLILAIMVFGMVSGLPPAQGSVLLVFMLGIGWSLANLVAASLVWALDRRGLYLFTGLIAFDIASGVWIIGSGGQIGSLSALGFRVLTVAVFWSHERLFIKRSYSTTPIGE